MWVQPYRSTIEQVPPKLDVEHKVAVLLAITVRLLGKAPPPE